MNGSPIQPSEICFGAADLIDKHGWIRGIIGNEERGFCMIGAIRRSSEGAPIAAYHDAIKATDSLIPYGQSLATYNDQIAKDKRHVTRKLRAAGRQLAKEGR